MVRRLTKVVATLAVILAVAAGAAYHYLWRSLPLLDGTIAVTGIRSTVDIVRDADAIPHVFAANKLDALFGLGYVHAQDRLWQMEFQRRIGFGRLSEIFGSATVPQDRFLRTVGFGRAATAAWERMPDWAREQVNAYTAGVNAFISSHHGAALPPEFSLLRFEPEPFTGADVTVWVKMMAWDLSANYSFELLRDDLTRAVGEHRMNQLMPAYAVNGLSITGEQNAGADESNGSSRSIGSRETARSGYGQSAAAFVRALSQGDAAVADLLLGNSRFEALGSNNWVIDGTMSATGKPLLTAICSPIDLVYVYVFGKPQN